MCVIECLTDPPPEIIEVSWNQNQQSLQESLRLVTGNRDRRKAGEWLLGLLREKHFDAAVDLTWCARKAMHIARATELDECIYHEFDGLEDDSLLTRRNPGNDMDACRHLMREALAKYPSPPSPSEA